MMAGRKARLLRVRRKVKKSCREADTISEVSAHEKPLAPGWGVWSNMAVRCI